MLGLLFKSIDMYITSLLVFSYIVFLVHKTKTSYKNDSKCYFLTINFYKANLDLHTLSSKSYY